MHTPLEGIKILDFSTLLPGPCGSMLLADLGADVVRIESLDRHDMIKKVPPFKNGVSAAHSYLNRSKKSLALDLKSPEATPIIHNLVKEFDIVIEQFRPGVMKKLKLSYEDLKETNPQLIYCSLTGYGQRGSFHTKAGHDINYLSLSGISSYTGKKDTGPIPIGVQLADVAGGSHYLAISILSAIIFRSRTQKGQHIDISMTDASFSLNNIYGASSLAGGPAPSYESTMLNGASLYDFYETKDERYISVGCLEPIFVENFFKALQQPELLEFCQNPDPMVQNELKSKVKNIIKQKNLDEWMEIFSHVDACVEPVLNLDESLKHKLFKEREMIIKVKDQHAEKNIDQIACPIKFSESKAQYRHTGVPLGNDTVEILTSLGYSEQTIADLRKNRIILQHS